jgi:hypothetical protein
MLPFFTYPLALAGLAAAVPALVAIYWLRRRFRRVPVSSLMLWLDPKPAREGGTRLDRLQTPLLFVLELAALVLLLLAAAEPQVQTAQRARPLVVVLDDSFSLRAGGPDSPRSRAVQALEQELRRSRRYSVRFVLAGERPQVLGEPAHTVGEALDALEKSWHCRAPAARLDEAVVLASEIGGELALVLVLTDQAPAVAPGKGRVQWWAFGKALPNLAFVTAARTWRDGAERCLLEIANLSENPATTSLVLEAGDPPAEVQRSTPALGPHETHRVILQLPAGTPALRARLGPDALDYDNRVTLLPTRPRPVRVGVRVADDTLRRPLEKALKAIREAQIVDSRPDVVFLDGQEDEGAGEAWRVHLIEERDGAAYTGPFVLDRAHPLTEGLSLQGIVWGAGKSADLPGAPVVLAGNVPLLTDQEVGARHEVRLRLRPDLSTLQSSPAWPVLVWNLLHWHAATAPGLGRPNIRLGEEATLTFPKARDAVEVVWPDGTARRVLVADRRLVVRAEDVGVYTVRNPEDKMSLASIAANALARDESDLSAAASGRWGDWLDETSLRLEYQNVSWVLLLMVLGVVTLHLVLVVRGG